MLPFLIFVRGLKKYFFFQFCKILSVDAYNKCFHTILHTILYNYLQINNQITLF